MTSSAERSEAINSMFEWYSNAATCYVYLSDVEMEQHGLGELYSYMEDETRILGAFRKCRWFTRGWTLQELVAPQEVIFFDRNWTVIGVKSSLCKEISEITGIEESVLLHRRSIGTYSVATKMSWAARRSTTCQEDSAYCLLGLFDVNMPLIYGEGRKAFLRLQEEISKRSEDLTILAWENNGVEQVGSSPDDLSPLAPGPYGFMNSAGIEPVQRFRLTMTITNRGLQLDGQVGVWTDRKGSASTTPDEFVLAIGQTANSYVGIRVQEIQPGVLIRVGHYLSRSTSPPSMRDDARFVMLWRRPVKDMFTSATSKIPSDQQPVAPAASSAQHRPKIKTRGSSLLNEDPPTSALSSSIFTSDIDMESTLPTSVQYSSRKPEAVPGSIAEIVEEQAWENMTTYSEATTSSARPTNLQYISTLSLELFDQATKRGPDDLSKAAEAMPSILQGFARRIGAEGSVQTNRDIMRFVSRHKTSQFLDKLAVHVEIENEIRLESDDEMAFGEKIRDWLPNVEHDATDAVDHSITVDTRETEDPEEDHTSNLLPELAVYRQVIIKSSAYKWLLSKVDRQLWYYIPEGRHIDQISNAVFSHEAYKHVSRKSAPPILTMVYVVDWDPFAFFREQNYDDEPQHATWNALTLIGVATNAEAVSCGDYLRRMWPQSGHLFLALIQSVLSSESRVWHHSAFDDGTKVQASTQPSGLVLNASGPPDTVVEIGEQLAWIAAALRPSSSRVCSVIPSIRRVVQTGQTPSSVSMSIDLAFIVEPEKINPGARNGNCWQLLFSKPAMVQGYPIRRRPSSVHGLEMPLDLMAAVVQANRISVFNRRPFVKGYCTLLYTADFFDDMIFWHALTNEDESYIQYHDPRILQPSAEMVIYPSVKELAEARHFVGWYSDVNNSVGASTVDFAIKTSDLGGPKPGFAFESGRISYKVATALQAAAARGIYDAVELLISNGVDVNEAGNSTKGATALQFAIEKEHSDVENLLFANGADVNAPPSAYSGTTCLRLVARNGLIKFQR